MEHIEMGPSLERALYAPLWTVRRPRRQWRIRTAAPVEWIQRIEMVLALEHSLWHHYFPDVEALSPGLQ